MISKCRGASAACRVSREAWYKSAIGAENSWDDEFHASLNLVKSGPFCFVDATDPRALNFTRANAVELGERTRSAGHCESRLSWGHPRALRCASVLP